MPPSIDGVTPKRLALIVQEILIPVTYTFSGGGGGDDLKQLPSKKTATKLNKEKSIVISSEQPVSLSLADKMFVNYHGTDFLKKNFSAGEYKKLQLDDNYECFSQIELFLSNENVYQNLKELVLSGCVTPSSSDPAMEIKTITLNVADLLGSGASLASPVTVKIEEYSHSLHFKEVTAAPKTLLLPSRLLTYMLDLKREVKKIVALAKQSDAIQDGNVLSGRRIEEVIQFVYEQSWSLKQYNLENVEMIKSVVEIPDTFKPKKQRPLDGSFFPKGIVCYLAYVCEQTRITDEFYHLFLGDGKELDNSAASSRADSRRKTNEEKKKPKGKAGKMSEYDGMLIEHRHQEVKLLMDASGNQYDRLTVAVCQKEALYKSIESRANKQFDRCQICIHDLKDAEALQMNNMWQKYLNLTDEVDASMEHWKTAMKEAEAFRQGDTTRDEITQLLGRKRKVAYVDLTAEDDKMSSSTPSVVKNRMVSKFATPPKLLWNVDKEYCGSELATPPSVSSQKVSGTVTREATGSLVSAKCSFCNIMPTNHYCYFETPTSGWHFAGKRTQLYCGRPFCLAECVQKYQYQDSDNASSLCPLHHPDSLK